MANIPLKGSERRAVEGARVLAPAEPRERMEVSVIVRRRAAPRLLARLAALVSGHREVGYLTREEFASQHGAQPPDLAAVRAFATRHGLAVVQEHAARRTVVLSGTVAQFSTAFSVQLHAVRTARRQLSRPYAARSSCRRSWMASSKPCSDSTIVHRRVPISAASIRDAATKKGRATAAPVSYTPLQVAALYGFPSGTGKGQCVAIIELGGGFRPADLTNYFSGLKSGSPQVTAVSVDHGQNSPTGDANGPDGEVMLDIEVVGAIAPAASIAVYFAPNTDAGFLDAITTAIHDTTNKPSVISISWGSAESTWTAQAMTAMDDAFQAAASMGITVCVASGDNGSTDGVSDGSDHVDFPASSPFALGLRRHHFAQHQSGHRFRVGVERRHRRRRQRGRCQQLLRYSGLADGPDSIEEQGQARGARQPRRSRRRRRCRSEYRLQGTDRRSRHGDWRHERSRTPVGWADRAAQSLTGKPQAINPMLYHGARAARHYSGQQR